ncbi:MAG: hypothetical protein AB7L66_14035 [Gemmatimonadales bacterium]
MTDTEDWVLHLEQVDDGEATGVQNPFPRRGSIWARLRLNRTEQLDPVCAGESIEYITTVLASATVPPTRLQPRTTGSFDGSWNCRGLRATLRLDDGTTYTLTSEEPAGFSSVFRMAEGLAWRSGVRRGHFSLLNEDDGLPGTRAADGIVGSDTHVDVVVDNQSGGPKRIRLAFPPSTRVDRLSIPYAGNAVLPAAGPITLSWPAHLSRSSVAASQRPEGRGWTVLDPDGSAIEHPICVLGPNHPDLLVLTVAAGGAGQCTDGWLGSQFVSAPAEAYLRATPADTVTLEVVTEGVDTVWATVEHPSLSARVRRRAGFGRVFDLELVAGTGLPLTDHGITIWGLNRETGDSTWTIVTVHHYDLRLSITPDPIRVAPGADSAIRIGIERRGIVAAFMEVRIEPFDLPTWPSAFASWRIDESPTLDTVAFIRFTAASDPGTFHVNACGSDPAHPDRCQLLGATIEIERPVLALIKASRHDRPERAGQPASVLPAVRVADAGDRSVAGIPITFRLADAASGTITDSVVTTDAAGIARLGGWQLGPSVGTQTVIAEAPGASGVVPTSIRFEVPVGPGSPVSLAIAAGANQAGAAGTAVAVPPRVVVRDAFGNPVPNVAIRFVVELGGGSVGGPDQVTDAAGEAAVGSWVLGAVPGPNLLIAMVAAGGAGIVPSSVAFSATGQ